MALIIYGQDTFCKINDMKNIAVLIFIFISVIARGQNSTCSILVLEKIISNTTVNSELIIIDSLGNQQTITNSDFFLQTGVHEGNLNSYLNTYSNLGYLICSTTIYSYGSINNTYYIWTRYILCKGGGNVGVSEIELSNNKILLSPNPSSIEIRIIVNDSKLLNTNYSIADIHGKELLKGKITNEVMYISIENLPTGIYFFKYSDNGNSTLKFIKT